MKKAIFSVALISVFASNAKAQDLKSIFGTIKKEVEKVNTQTSTTNKTTSTKNNSHIKTGDDMPVLPYILLMATAGGYIALQRRNKED